MAAVLAAASGEVTRYPCDACCTGRRGSRYPQIALPDAGPACAHLQMSAGFAGPACWASWDPQGVQDAFDRELIMAMPWLADPPAAYRLADWWWV